MTSSRSIVKEFYQQPLNLELNGEPSPLAHATITTTTHHHLYHHCHHLNHDASHLAPQLSHPCHTYQPQCRSMSPTHATVPVDAGRSCYLLGLTSCCQGVRITLEYRSYACLTGCHVGHLCGGHQPIITTVPLLSNQTVSIVVAR